MTRRFLRLFALLWLLTLACALPQTARAEGVEVKRALVEAADDGYRLSASYGFELNQGLEDALLHGISLYFTTEIEFTRPRWYWFPEQALAAHQTIRIEYNVLTKKYHVATIENWRQSLQQDNFATLDEALFMIRRPNRWLIAARGALKAGETYNVSLRMQLDPNYLPKPIQLSAFNNADWRLSSGKKTFTYRPE